MRAWHRNNLERHKEMSDKWLNTVRESGLTNKRVQALKNKYGLTEQQYLTILQQQDYKCVICETPVVDTGLRAGRYSATIDHNHINGAVRGILCNWCNTSIARFNDEPAMLHRAAKYLEERGEGIPLPPS